MATKVKPTDKVKVPAKLPEAVLDFFREQGRQGGLVGGVLSSTNLTKAQRKKRATEAGIASGEARRRKAAEKRAQLELAEKRKGKRG